MSSKNVLTDADLKSRLANYGINCPITNTTRNVLLHKLSKLDSNNLNSKTNASSDQLNKYTSNDELMDTTVDDLNEYEIKDGISNLGFKTVPLTDSTRPIISKIIKKKIRMEDSVNDIFLIEDDEDDMLAHEFEQKLNDFNDVKAISHCTNNNCAPIISNNKKINLVNKNKPSTSKKCSTMQSRLSTFFKKSENNEMGQEEIKCELLNCATESCVEVNSSQKNNEVNIISSQDIFSKEPGFEGFHLFSGSHYVYPSNYPIREYQMEIIKTALFNNTLIILPTDLGKTLIASVVMYNFYRWYPLCKIIFIAPTKQLISQQIEACYSVGFLKELTFDMSGNITLEHRYAAWKKNRIFFYTPQVLLNDLKQTKFPSSLIKCIVFDEAHRAVNDYAYVQVLKYLQNEKQRIRIIGLTAIPGNTVESVIEVIQNLNISKLEYRAEDSPDVIKYSNAGNINYISVKLTNDILNIRSQFLVIYNKYSRQLKQYNLLNGNITNITKCQLLTAKQKFVNSHNNMTTSLKESIINDFDICMSLAFVLELLIIYGVKVFYLKSLEIMENHNLLLIDDDLKKILDYSKSQIHCKDLTWSHPKFIKLKQIIQNYFGIDNVSKNNKTIIFCQYQFVVIQIYELLKTFGSNVKPAMFVDQSLKDKGGLLQKDQIEVMKQYKNGYYNVLIVTSIAEDQDFEDVDLIISLEANKCPIKFIQRLSRTGQKCPGKCITLLTEGKELTKYKSSIESNKTLCYKILENPIIYSNLPMYSGPRLIPEHINPQLLMIHINDIKEKEHRTKRNDKQLTDKSKKQKTTEFKKDNTISSFDNNAIGNFESNFINDVYDNNTFIINKSSENIEACNSDIFLNENEIYNKWKKISKHSNTDILNNTFFELLYLFTDCSSKNDSDFDNEILMCSTNFNEYNRENDIKEKSFDEKKMVSVTGSPEVHITKVSKEMLHQLTICSRASDCSSKNDSDCDNEIFMCNTNFNEYNQENDIKEKSLDKKEMVSVTGSPEVHVTKVSKEMLHQLTNISRASSPEIINLLTPDFATNEDENKIIIEDNINNSLCSNVNNNLSTSTAAISTDDLLLIQKDHNDFDIITHEKNVFNNNSDIFTQYECASTSHLDNMTNKLIKANNSKLQKPLLSTADIKPSLNVNSKNEVLSSETYSNVFLPSNIIKACNLIKPGFSLKRNITESKQRFDHNSSKKLIKESPIKIQEIPQITKFSQSTPKVPNQRETVNFLTSSSDESDIFVDHYENHNSDTIKKTKESRQKLRKRNTKRKKLVFIDDEAEVSNCFDNTAINTNKIFSDDEDETDNNEDFDSSFIDDEKDMQSTFMTKHYLQSIKSPSNTRGTFKIPKLTNRHYDINVYSQMENKSESCYLEDSFCVEDTSDVNTSSNISVEDISDRPLLKRRRILSPQSSDGDDD